MKSIRKIFKPKTIYPPDKYLLFSFIALILLGFFFLASASAVVSYNNFGHAYHYIIEQLVPLIIGTLLFFLFYKPRYDKFKKFASLALILSIISLILVFIPSLGIDHSGSQSWIKIFGRSFQPAEMVKLSFLIYLATWLEAKKGDLSKLLSGTLPFILVLSIISLLIMLQPDFGTLVIIISSALAAFLVGGGSLKHFSLIVFMGLIVVASMIFFKSDYQERRIRCYLNPGTDRQGQCYQINQSLIAVGSGGLLGRGVGESRQKFLYVPEVTGDAIFPIIAEEIGFVFSLLLLLLYIIFFYRGYLIAKGAPDLFARALAFGIVFWLAIQTFFNIGGMINLIPMTGVPLPFISHGGSSLMFSMAAVGLLLNISRYSKLN